MSMNGYNSSSESPSDTGGIMSKSPGSHEDDDLEEDDRPSPSPLSLTTRQPQSSPQNVNIIKIRLLIKNNYLNCLNSCYLL